MQPRPGPGRTGGDEPQPRCVPWTGIEPTTRWCAGRWSNHCVKRPGCTLYTSYLPSYHCFSFIPLKHFQSQPPRPGQLCPSLRSFVYPGTWLCQADTQTLPRAGLPCPLAAGVTAHIHPSASHMSVLCIVAITTKAQIPNLTSSIAQSQKDLINCSKIKECAGCQWVANATGC